MKIGEFEGREKGNSGFGATGYNNRGLEMTKICYSCE